MRPAVARATLAAALVAAALGVTGAVPGARADIPDDLVLTLLTDDLQQPLALATAGDDRLFIVERHGRVRIWRNGELLPAPFLDLRSIVDSQDGEQGLLGL